MRSRLHPIDGILFDLGGTLTDGRDFEGWAADGRKFGLEVTAENLAAAWEKIRPWRTHRDTAPEVLWRDVLSQASPAVVPSGAVRQFVELQNLKPIYGALYSDARRCLDLLRREKLRLGVVSNSRSEPAVRALLKSLEIEDRFESVVSSGTEGVRKPAPEIFRRALIRMNLAENATVFIGDDLENDYHGAVAAGLHAVWLNRGGGGDSNGVPEILSLSEVPRVVRLIEAGAPVI